MPLTGLHRHPHKGGTCTHMFKWRGEKTPWVKCFLYKHEDQSLISKLKINCWVSLSYTYQSQHQEAWWRRIPGESLASQSSPIDELQVPVRDLVWKITKTKSSTGIHNQVRGWVYGSVSKVQEQGIELNPSGRMVGTRNPALGRQRQEDFCSLPVISSLIGGLQADERSCLGMGKCNSPVRSMYKNRLHFLSWQKWKNEVLIAKIPKSRC